MKYKKSIRILLFLIAVLTGLWGIPALVKKATYTPPDYPFVYYSSILKELCFVEFQDKKAPLRDASGNTYNEAQFDSLMPLLNYRQLLSDGNLPDSIDGHEISVPLLRATSVVFRYSPTDVNTPGLGLYIMYESMPKRVGLEMPEDIFRMDNRIEFINSQSNTINREKSQQFQQALEKAGYIFPAQWVSGNPNPRKAYDEGYFSLDASGRLFHLKMGNGRPFVRNTLIGEKMDIDFFSMYESGDKRFYGFLFDKQGGMYIIESQDGKYVPVRLGIDPVNRNEDEVLIMGNMLYWTVSVTRPQGADYFALHTETLDHIESYHIDRKPDTWDTVSKWVFPVYLTFEHDNSDFIYPRVHFFN